MSDILKQAVEGLQDSIYHSIWQDIHYQILLQNEKWGIEPKPLETWFTILAEEIGEIAKDINECADPSHLEYELSQAAAVICQLMLHAKALQQPPGDSEL